MRFLSVLLLVAIAISGYSQTYRVLYFDAFNNIANCCDGELQGYSVWVHDTLNGEAYMSEDSVAYYYDSKDRVEKIELFRMGYFPVQDTTFGLDQWLKAGYLNDSQVGYVVYHGDAFSLPASQPRDSVVYEYYGNGLIKTITTYNYNNGNWGLGERERHLRLPDGRDTAIISEKYSGGSWSTSYYKRFVYNQDSLPVEESFYSFISEPWRPVYKWKNTYNANGLRDTSKILYYDDSIQGLFLADMIVEKYDTLDRITLRNDYIYDTTAQKWNLVDSNIYAYPPDTYYVRQLHQLDSSENLVHAGFDVRITDSFGHAFTDWKEYYFDQGDTIMAIDRKRYYLDNGYPDSFYSYYTSTPYGPSTEPNERKHESKFYYSDSMVSVAPVPTPIRAKLFPNPAGNVLNLRLPKRPKSAIRFHIFTIDGQLVKRGVLPPQTNSRLPLPEAGGTYIYELEIDGQRIGKKIIHK